MEDGLALPTAPFAAGEREAIEAGRQEPWMIRMGCGLYQFPGSAGWTSSRWSGWRRSAPPRNLAAALLQRAGRSAAQPGGTLPKVAVHAPPNALELRA